MFFRRGQCKNPCYPIEHWNSFSRVMSNIPRTTNHVEGWHNGFNSIIAKIHPTIWHFIDAIKLDQSLKRVDILHIINNTPQTPEPKRKRDQIAQLQSIASAYDDKIYKNKINYVKAMANCMKL